MLPNQEVKCTFSSTGVKSTTHPYCCVRKIWFQLFDMKKLSPDDFCTLYHGNLSILPYRVIIITSSIMLLTGLCEQKLCSCSIVILVPGATTLCYSNEVHTSPHMKLPTEKIVAQFFMLTAPNTNITYLEFKEAN